MKEANAKDLSLLLLLSVIWGSAFFNIKIATYSFGPVTIAFLRVLFGAIPDLLSFGVYFVFQIFSSGLDLEKSFSEKIPLWVYSLYDISHSLVIAFIFIGIAYNVNKDFAWPMLGWPLHIVIDLFTHSIEFFPTPIFWPIFLDGLLRSERRRRSVRRALQWPTSIRQHAHGDHGCLWLAQYHHLHQFCGLWKGGHGLGRSY